MTDMTFWINFWTVIFFASVAIFAGLAVVVSIGGFFNILSLLKGLKERAERQDEGCCETDSD